MLFIQTQPGATAQNGVDFAQQPVIQLRDASNNPVNQPGVVVSASILSGGGALNGTTTATTNASGVASFNDLAITGVVGSRTLDLFGQRLRERHQHGNHPHRRSRHPACADNTAFQHGPERGVFPTQPVVQLKDQSGNNVSQNNVSVDAAIATAAARWTGPSRSIPREWPGRVYRSCHHRYSWCAHLDLQLQRPLERYLRSMV